MHKRRHWQPSGDALLWAMLAKREADYSMNEPLKKYLKSASLRKWKSGPLECCWWQVFWIKCFLGHSWSLGERDIEESKKNTVVAVCSSIPVIPSTSEAAKIQGEVKKRQRKTLGVLLWLPHCMSQQYPHAQMCSLHGSVPATASPDAAGLRESRARGCCASQFHSLSLSQKKNCSNSAGQDPGKKTNEDGGHNIPTSQWAQHRVFLGTTSTVFQQNTDMLSWRLGYNSDSLT